MQLVYATEKYEKDCNQIMTASFLDLSKTFGSNSQEILLTKLKKLNFDKKISVPDIKFLDRTDTKSSNRKTSKSDWINLYQGVPQTTGTLSEITRSSFFLIFMSNKNSVESPVYLIHYADDTFLYVVASDIVTDFSGRNA